MKGRLSVATLGAALACASLFGCGGGGGGGDGPAGLPPVSSTPIAISATNMNQVADAALDPAVGGTGAFGASISSTDTVQSNPRVLLRAMQAVSDQAKKPRTSSGLTDSPDSGPCAVSGSVTIVASANSASITFNNCSDVPGQVLNGSVSATGVSETSTSFAATFNVDLTFTETGSQALRLVGNFSISENCASPGVNCVGTFSGSSLGAAHGSEVWYISSFSITAVDVVGGFVDVSASYTVSSSQLNGSVQVITSPPIRFAAGANYPESGTIQITGANSTSAVITINSSVPSDSNAVLVQVDTNSGTPGFEFTEDYSWLELEAI
jgi:hypothetical protein